MKRNTRQTSKSKASGGPVGGYPFSQRTITVWVTLVMAMAVVSGLLLALNPSPIPPTGGSAPLAMMDGLDEWHNTITNPRQPLAKGKWNAIVIHHSGEQSGNAERIGQLHQKIGYGSLGFHFVIDNGPGDKDGLVEVGYRWDAQLQGQYAKDAISICLVGNGDKSAPTAEQMRSLVRLVGQLCKTLDIPSSQVYTYSQFGLAHNTVRTSSPGVKFPVREFQKRVMAAVDAGDDAP